MGRRSTHRRSALTREPGDRPEAHAIDSGGLWRFLKNLPRTTLLCQSLPSVHMRGWAHAGRTHELTPWFSYCRQHHHRFGIAPCGPPAENEVIVTATRVAETTDESLASVTVIDRATLDRSQPKDMAEVLRMVPGIDIARTGGPGSDTSIFLRGSNSNHVLVLIDGVRASSATTGAFSWQHLQPALIERIEVVRGPRAALYGSDAIGGVIQIFTRKVSSPFVRLEAGSFGTRSLQAGIGGGDRVRFHINAEQRETDGFSAQNSNGGSYDPDDDGAENISFNAGMNIDVSAATQLSLVIWRSASDVEFDSGTQESINQTFQTRLIHSVNDLWIQTLTLGHTVDELETRSSSPSAAETRRISFDWQNDIALSRISC